MVDGADQAAAFAAKSDPILMSAENPGGWKLETLLERVAFEIQQKTGRIGEDPRPAAAVLRANNRAIVALLRAASDLQLGSLATLATLGPDQGPTGTPRIGIGSAPADDPRVPRRETAVA